jgi:Outer membrane protein beta-barrel domain
VRKSLVVLGAALLSALVASAAEETKFETFLGYDFVGYYPNTNVIPKAHFNGGSGQFVYNFNKWLGAVADIGAVHKGLIGGYNVDTTIANYVFGPRLAYHSSSRLTPFFQVLFGGASGSTSAQVSALLPTGGPVVPPGFVVDPTRPFTARINASQTAFAMMAGGGVDIKLSKHVAFRPIEFDYYLTRFSNPELGGINNQNNWRYSAGVNFLFGAR